LGFNAFVYAVLNNKTEAAKILIDKGVDINIEDKLHDTEIFWLALSKNKEIVKYILDKEDKLNIKNETKEKLLKSLEKI